MLSLGKFLLNGLGSLLLLIGEDPSPAFASPWTQTGGKNTFGREVLATVSIWCSAVAWWGSLGFGTLGNTPLCLIPVSVMLPHDAPSAAARAARGDLPHLPSEGDLGGEGERGRVAMVRAAMVS